MFYRMVCCLFVLHLWFLRFKSMKKKFDKLGYNLGINAQKSIHTNEWGQKQSDIMILYDWGHCKTILVRCYSWWIKRSGISKILDRENHCVDYLVLGRSKPFFSFQQLVDFPMGIVQHICLLQFIQKVFILVLQLTQKPRLDQSALGLSRLFGGTSWTTGVWIPINLSLLCHTLTHIDLLEWLYWSFCN